MDMNLNLVKEPKISIIITYFNLGKYIKDCVSSVLEQTYKNYEVIIVNDGSDAKNSRVLDDLKNDNIKIIRSRKNEGQLCAFLKGLKSAKGEFICMVDADDVLLSNHLKTLLYSHLKYNYALISSSCGEINSDNEITSLDCISNIVTKKETGIKYSDVDNAFSLSDSFDIKPVKEPFGLWSWNASTSAMFRKSSLDIIKYFPNKEYWKTGADKVIFSLLHLIGGSANISAVTYLYRHHSKNQSQTNLTSGNKKYLSEKYIEKLIAWNKKIRIDTLTMLKENRYDLIQQYNKINYSKMLLQVMFCINLKICAKIIKTFAHKLIRY